MGALNLKDITLNLSIRNVASIGFESLTTKKLEPWNLQIMITEDNSSEEFESMPEQGLER